MTALRLYEITDALQAIAEELIDNAGELTPELTARLDALEGAFDAKVERVALYVRNLEAQADVAKGEAVRLQLLATVRGNAASRLRDYIKTQMEAANRPKVETGLIVARVQKNGQPSVKCDGDPATLPLAYQRTRVELNRAAVIEAWRAGLQLPAGLSVETHTHLRLS